MKQTFLIPAGNSKKQSLIFGFLLPLDAIILSIGIGITFILLLTLPLEEIWAIILAITPVAVASALVFPMPNYHNVRMLIIEIFKFFTNRRKYIWRGWCYTYEQSESNAEFIPNAKLRKKQF